MENASFESVYPTISGLRWNLQKIYLHIPQEKKFAAKYNEYWLSSKLNWYLIYLIVISCVLNPFKRGQRTKVAQIFYKFVRKFSIHKNHFKL